MHRALPFCQETLFGPFLFLNPPRAFHSPPTSILFGLFEVAVVSARAFWAEFDYRSSRAFLFGSQSAVIRRDHSPIHSICSLLLQWAVSLRRRLQLMLLKL